MEETRVDQMHGSVLDTAGIGVHRHPIVILLGIEGTFAVMRTQIAQVVPRRAHKGVHGVRLALGRFATYGAGGVLPGGVQLERTLPRG